MAEDKKNTRRKAAELRKALEDVESGKDIVAISLGAKGIVTFEDVMASNEKAKLFAPPKRRVGRPTKYDPSWMLDAIIEVARLGASKEKMAATIGISKETLYQWCQDYPEFSDAVKEGELLSQVWWENFGQSAALGAVDGFNATSWIFSMKNRFPGIYRDVKVTELNSTGGPLIDARSITINARELDDDTREKVRAAIEAVRMLQRSGDDDD